MSTTEELLRKAMEKSDVSEVETILDSMNPLALALLKANSSDDIKEILLAPELLKFWTEKFNLLHIKSDSSFRFRDPAPQSKADFYCGWILFLQAKKVDQKVYFKLAAETFNSFHAYRSLLLDLVKSCNESFINEYGVILSRSPSSEVTFETQSLKDQIDLLLTEMNKISFSVGLFKTPGFLLLASTYFYIASFYQRLGFTKEAIASYSVCWENLCKADLYQETSVREIHNAYLGKGLVVSNSWGYKTIEEFKDGFVSKASEAVPAANRIAIEDRVRSAHSVDTVKVIEKDDSEDILSGLDPIFFS